MWFMCKLIWILHSETHKTKFYSIWFVFYLVRNITICSGLPYVLLRFHFFLFSILCSGIVGNGVVRPADMLGSEVLGNYCGEDYVITVLRDVT
jgi:hypothetical protein